jgi:protocatechuate 3,4-dioxygenase beta subunit
MPGSIENVAPTDESRFLRGMQCTDATGTARFDTIYPGWYFSRAVHIHFRVLIGDVPVYTGQGFLPEQYNRLVSTLPPYSEHAGLEPIANEHDWPYAEFGGAETLIDVRPVEPDNPAAGLTAALTLAVVIPPWDATD